MQLTGNAILITGGTAHRARALRWAEKNGEYERLFSARNER